MALPKAEAKQNSISSRAEISRFMRNSIQKAVMPSIAPFRCCLEFVAAVRTILATREALRSTQRSRIGSYGIGLQLTYWRERSESKTGSWKTSAERIARRQLLIGRHHLTRFTRKQCRIFGTGGPLSMRASAIIITCPYLRTISTKLQNRQTDLRVSSSSERATRQDS